MINGIDGVVRETWLIEQVLIILGMANKNLFKYFKTSPEIIRLAVMFYVRYPLGFR